MSRRRKLLFLRRVSVVLAYATAMGYLEAAVVVYLQRALTMTPATLFPLQDQAHMGGLGAIEIGREVATLVMLAAVGWFAGRTPMERIAWGAVLFGMWDITYYFWLWIFIGWPTSLGTTDLLFLMPVPWVGPIYAPIAVSAILIFCGITICNRINRGLLVTFTRTDWLLMLLGGLVVVVSFTLDARHILKGGLPGAFDWPVFLAGIAIALYGAKAVLKRA